MIVRDVVSSFIGGISQQTEKMMLPQHSKVLENQSLDIVEGLKRRPPTKNIAKLLNEPLIVHPYIHTIIKEDGKYQVIFDGTTCKVFDLEGNQKTVTVTEAASNYIQTQTPLTDLYAVTLADYTFILNKTKKTALKNDLYPNAYTNSALVFVKQGSYSNDYKITLNGITVTYTTDSTNADTIKTNHIASQLKSALEGVNISGFSYQVNGSTIYIAGSNSFTINTEDSNGGDNLLSFYRTTDTATDLPVIAPNGYILNITQDAKEGADDYFVKFTTNDGSGFGQGTWSECPSPNVKYKLDNTTMPMALVRGANGTFTLDVIAWGERLSGDEETAPSPSFVGNTIQEIITYKGRLGFISVDKIIFSDVNDIFSFFKKTVLTDLDTDPIDIMSNSKMVLLKHSLPFNQELMLASETAQFIVKGGDTFSNSTVSLDLVTSYQCSKDCKPISIGANGYFVYENGAYTRIRSLFITNNLIVDAEDITEQCPSYLPNNVYKLAGSAANNVMLVLSTQERESIYVYNFYMKENTRVQSAWHKWVFEGAKLLNVDFDKHLLYLTIQYNDGVYLEVIDFTPKLKDFELDYLLYLDRKFTITTLLEDETGKYFNLPYGVYREGFKVVDSKGFNVSYNATATKCYIKESRLPVIAGFIYNSKWQFPTIYVRSETENSSKVQEGLLMLRDITLTYANSGYFKVKVEPKYTTQMGSEFKFTGKVVGLPSSTIGRIKIESGTFLLPIIARNEDIEITLENNSYLPSCYLSMEWIGDFVQRGKNRY